MKTEDTFDPFADLKKIAPECFFEPKYPYVFKFDLILEGVNYGEIEVIVKDDLDISELKGDTETLKKLDEINKKREQKAVEEKPTEEDKQQEDQENKE